MAPGIHGRLICMATTIAAASYASKIAADIRALPHPTTATVRGVRRVYSKRLKAADPDTILDIARRLLDKSEFVYRFVAYELIHYHRPALRSLRPSHLRQLGRGLNSWYAVDTFAPLLSGPAWREGQAPDSLIRSWARSKDRWWRRAALVSTVALNNKARGGRGDADRTLAICKLLVQDREDMVVKAMSWALRELAKHDPGTVSQFLTDHDGNLAARVVREANNKIRTGLKNPKKKS